MQQEVKVIGRGTWLDRVADEVITREKRLGRSLTLIRVESGIAASGTPHIGNVGDAIRSYGVKMALESAGYRSELIAFCYATIPDVVAERAASTPNLQAISKTEAYMRLPPQ